MQLISLKTQLNLVVILGNSLAIALGVGDLSAKAGYVQTRADGTYYIDFRGIPVISLDGNLTSPLLNGKIEPTTYQGKIPGVKFSGTIQDEFVPRGKYTGTFTDPKTGTQYQGTFDFQVQGPRYSDSNGGTSPTVFDFQSQYAPGMPAVPNPKASFNITGMPASKFFITIPPNTPIVGGSNSGSTAIRVSIPNPSTTIITGTVIRPSFNPAFNQGTTRVDTNAAGQYFRNGQLVFAAPSGSTPVSGVGNSNPTPTPVSNSSGTTSAPNVNNGGDSTGKVTSTAPSLFGNNEIVTVNRVVLDPLTFSDNCKQPQSTSTETALPNIQGQANCTPQQPTTTQPIGPRSRVLLR